MGVLAVDERIPVFYAWAIMIEALLISIVFSGSLLKRSRCVLATVFGLALLSGKAAAQQDASSLLQRHTELRSRLANS